MSSKKRKAASPKLVLAIAVMFVLGSIYPLYVAWQAWRLGNADQPSTCEIVSKRVVESRDSENLTDGYFPAVEIAHTVDGQRYTREDHGKRYGISSDAINSIVQLSVGSSVPCRYVAGAPQYVVVLEQHPNQFPAMLGFGLFLWVIPLAVFLWERKQPGWTGP